MGEPSWVVKQWADYDEVMVETLYPADARRLCEDLNTINKDRRYKFVVMPKDSKDFKRFYNGPG